MNIASLLAATRSTPAGAATAATPRPPARSTPDVPVAEQFEALFLGQLLKGMRKTVPVTDEGNTAREIYQEMHDEMLASHLAKRGGIGLAAMIRSYLDRAQAAGGKK